MDIVLGLIGLIAAGVIAIRVDRLFRRPPGPVKKLAEQTLMDRDIATYLKQREAEEQERLREENIRNAAPPIPWQKVEKRPPFVLPQADAGPSVPWAASPSTGARRSTRP